jgi:hypothetical protein
MRQAENMMAAVLFAKSVGLALVAHLTIHWACTDVGDDPDGKLFAKVREGLDKWLGRQGVGFAAVWARERQSGGQSDVEHCHMLFHLPHEYRAGKKLHKVENAIYRLISRHGRRDGDKKGDGYWADEVAKLVIHENPDGKYLIKGGGLQVWKRFRLRREHRRWQGLIHGKRCGTTQNIGPAARRCWNEHQHRQGKVHEQRPTKHSRLAFRRRLSIASCGLIRIVRTALYDGLSSTLADDLHGKFLGDLRYILGLQIVTALSHLGLYVVGLQKALCKFTADRKVHILRERARRLQRFDVCKTTGHDS